MTGANENANVPRPSLYPHVLRWLSLDEATSNCTSIDQSCLADEIHEFAQSFPADRFEAIISKMLSTYRQGRIESIYFVHQFIPLFANMYLKSNRHEQNSDALELFFLGVYNLSLVADTESIQIPIFQKGKSSGTIYGPPTTDTTPGFTTLKTFRLGGRQFFPVGTLQSQADLESVFLKLIILFNESITGACWQARHQFCLFAQTVVSKKKDDSGNLAACRLYSVPIAIEIVSCLHYLCRNEMSESAYCALQAFDARGQKDLTPELMLLTRSVILLLRDFNEKFDQISNMKNRSETSFMPAAKGSPRGEEPSNVKGANDSPLTEKAATTTRDVQAVHNNRTASTLDELNYIEIESAPGLAVPGPVNPDVNAVVVPERKHKSKFFRFRHKNRWSSVSQNKDESKVQQERPQTTI